MPEVRIGMDTGEVISEDAGYFGATVFRASRIADIARGGQTLVSQTVRLLASSVPVDFVDAGEHELKGLDGRHRLFEVHGRDGPGLGSAGG
jgi:class 3 adenylate cyclase